MTRTILRNLRLVEEGVRDSRNKFLTMHNVVYTEIQLYAFLVLQKYNL